ncbi:helix-turn-helix domain-containing protein [uncultured Megasphaera sp.]|uniref:helix-turn-helix domain-containing protein n=1 Tax=uncultured Megasphaera sp. TaxID=165188 RepID=UPI00266DBF99|nr:helix-turn-helix transcriptional regulator [uncultured Megasphaera sp.]
MTEQFGTKLKKIRIEKNMSQDEMATFLGTSKQVISRYEKNQRTPKITTAQEYAVKLNVPLLYLIDDTVTSLDFSDNNDSDNLISLGRSISSEDLEILTLYMQLDEIDRAEIRGEIRGMLRANKYTDTKKENTEKTLPKGGVG